MRLHTKLFLVAFIISHSFAEASVCKSMFFRDLRGNSSQTFERKFLESFTGNYELDRSSSRRFPSNMIIEVKSLIVKGREVLDLSIRSPSGPRENDNIILLGDHEFSYMGLEPKNIHTQQQMDGATETRNYGYWLSPLPGLNANIIKMKITTERNLVNTSSSQAILFSVEERQRLGGVVPTGESRTSVKIFRMENGEIGILINNQELAVYRRGGLFQSPERGR